jgi:hypothetical protein
VPLQHQPLAKLDCCRVVASVGDKHSFKVNLDIISGRGVENFDIDIFAFTTISRLVTAIFSSRYQ